MKVKDESEKVGLKLNIQKTKIMASSPITSWQIDGETVETVADFLFLGSKITADGDCSHEIKRRLLLGRKVLTYLDSILKKQWHYFVNKDPSSQGCGFSSSHVWMWELDYKENWVQKNWCFWRLMLVKTLFFFFCSGFCHTLKWNSHGFTCVPHPDPPSHLPLHPLPLGLPSAPGPSACLMHPTWAGDLFHPR